MIEQLKRYIYELVRPKLTFDEIASGKLDAGNFGWEGHVRAYVNHSAASKRLGLEPCIMIGKYQDPIQLTVYEATIIRDYLNIILSKYDNNIPLIKIVKHNTDDETQK